MYSPDCKLEQALINWFRNQVQVIDGGDVQQAFG
jgi:hypothetical protein